MEGPTPVSALIHAATMVTAGVFLLIRCSALFEYAPNILCFITLIGGLTTIFGATIGLTQFDIKKIIAYSTCSQLGYMIMCCGLSEYTISLYHLINHAFFKALLFLGAGAIIHAMLNEQDIRKMGGIIQLLPYTYILMFIGSLSLIGFPFLSGFYSKDLIIELVHETYTIPSQLILLLSIMSVFCTSFYSTRLLFLTFFSSPRNYRICLQQTHEVPHLLNISLFILALGSIFSGYSLEELLVGIYSDFCSEACFKLPHHFKLDTAEILSNLNNEKIEFLKLKPLLLVLLGICTAYLRYITNLTS